MTNTNPETGTRCGECRLGLGTHPPEDPYCDFHNKWLRNNPATGATVNSAPLLTPKPLEQTQ